MTTGGARPTVLPFGSWPTPITSEVVVAEAVGLYEVRVDHEDLLWSEDRPGEDGRTALVRRSADGGLTELLGPSQSARTAVHEYGGGAWWADDGVVWFCSWEDQRLYRRDPITAAAEPLTPAPEAPRSVRYADGALSPDGSWIACVRERHAAVSDGEIGVRNEIVRLAAHRPSVPEVLVSGPDFVASPRFSRDGARLCWVEWDHPNMPWDGTRLLVRDQASGRETLVAGGPAESVWEPQWQADGSLTFISDRNGWWNLYRFSPHEQAVSVLVETDADIGVAQWVLADSRYAVLDDGRVLFARWKDGFDRLAVALDGGSVAALALPFSVIWDIRGAGGASVVVVAGTPTEEAAIVRVELGTGAALAGVDTLRPGRGLRELGVDRAQISVPEPVDFPSAGGRTAHALFYAPTSPGYAAPEGELPPLLVKSHGGPTSAAVPQLSLSYQYWTSRGFAVLDVNYGGSTGFGRAYRDLLRGAWGVVDVEDCIAAAGWLARAGRVDPARLCIRGSSSGGFTTLSALARRDTPFAAGADLFGVADLERFVADTHKFESRYLGILVGPYPEQRELYRQRSPISHVDDLSRPLIVLQGLEDEVVPPNQATMIVEALRAKGVPVAYVAFEGEQHGFRQSANIRRALDAELSFYAQVLGFDLPAEEGIEPVELN